MASSSYLEEAPPIAVPARVADGEVARREVLTLLASIFAIAGCGLVYELLIATVSSYLLGSSVTQFSVSIGVFIGAMGVGSHLSQRVVSGLLAKFILIELALGLVGGVSVLVLFWSYAAGAAYWAALYAFLTAIGAMTGLELPLLTRMLKHYGELRTTIAQALSFDYLGALVGSLLFPLLLLPTLGMARTAFLIGLLNVGVAAWNVRVFRQRLRAPNLLLATSGVLGTGLATAFVFSFQLIGLAERQLYEDDIIYTSQTPYQRIVLTRWHSDLRLFIDGNLQFSSVDEYRYHEALVHPAMSLAAAAESVLILGGGDGLGAREVAKYPSVRRITLIDLDEKMTQLGRTYPAIVTLNKRALHDPRVRIVHEDAYKFLEQEEQRHDVIICDLPDPNHEALAKLYSVEFYKLLKRHLTAGGVLVTQATSPFFARDAFWCIVKTMEAAGLKVAPYHTYVPSFGDWGFVLAASREIRRDRAAITVPVKYLTPPLLREMFAFGKDVAEVRVELNTLDRPAIMQQYLKGWKRWE